MDNRILDFLAMNFDRYEDARQLWLASGGRPGMLLETNNARTRWSDALQKIDGGALNYQQFLGQALAAYPGNPVLLSALRDSLTSEQRQSLERVRQAMLTEDAGGAEVLFQEVRSLPSPAAQQAVVATAAHAVEIENPKASSSFWSKAKDTIATKGLEIIIQAAVSAGVKAMSGSM